MTDITEDAVGTGCDHDPGYQCVACVPEGGFRFEPLGAATRGVQIPASRAKNLGADPTTTCARKPDHFGFAHEDTVGDVMWVDLKPAGDELRTPEQWCAHYDVEIHNPDGWRGRNDPPWDQPITLPEFWKHAARSTLRDIVGDGWKRVSRDATKLESDGAK